MLSGSLSRNPCVIWAANRDNAVGSEWIMQPGCKVKKGGTAVIPSFCSGRVFCLMKSTDWNQKFLGGRLYGR